MNVRVKGKLLLWARRTSGYSPADAAVRIGVREEKLLAAEEDRIELTFIQLKNAADVYKRPLAAFFLRDVPESDSDGPRDFRLNEDMASRPLSPALNFTIRKATLVREDALELAAELGNVVPAFEPSAAIGSSPEEVASGIRRSVGLSDSDVAGWRTPNEALAGWKAAVESKSVLVLEASNVPVDEMRGLALWFEPLPVIVLNGGDSHTARCFSLIHEYTHLLIRQAAICDFAPGDAGSSVATTEAFCNGVAGAALVPAEALRLMLRDTGKREWSHEELAELGARFRVSKEVVLRRLLSMGCTSEPHYRKMRQEFLHEYSILRERQREKNRLEKKSGGPSPAVMALRNLGSPFVRLVLTAHGDDKIGLSTVSDYLGLKLKHLPRLRQLLDRNDRAQA